MKPESRHVGCDDVDVSVTRSGTSCTAFPWLCLRLQSFVSENGVPEKMTNGPEGERAF